MNRKKTQTFQFKQFAIQQDRCGFKVGTDGILLGAWADVGEARRALDIGTGTGLLALMLAQRNTLLQVDALEIDGPAAGQAAENVAASRWADRVTVWQTAVQQFMPPHKYDLIITNPPFYAAEQHSLAPDLARQRARQTTTLPYGDLLDCVGRLLAENGRFCLILPLETGRWFVGQARARGLVCVRETAVRPTPSKSPHRLLLAFAWPQQRLQLVRETLIIETEKRHEYTSAFQAATHSFYLKM